MSSLVTNAGLSDVIDRWIGSAIYLQAGTGSGQGVGAADLASPVQDRVVTVASQVTENVTGDTARLVGTVTAETDLTITEVGLFRDATGPAVMVYGDFTGIALAAGDAIVFQVSVTAS